MLAAAIYVHCSVSPALEKAAAAHPGLPLYVTGHSLGGAVAALLTLLLMHPNVRALSLSLSSLLAVQSLRRARTGPPTRRFLQEALASAGAQALC